MSESVNLPALGESVTEGTVTRWLKEVGDTVAVDEPLLEVSTDKVDTEIPSPFAGVLEEILVAEDETAEVGAPLARIGDGSGSAAQNEPAAEEPEQAPQAEPDQSASQQSAPASETATEPTEEQASAPATSGPGEEVTLPALGESVTEGTVTRWLKEVGDTVEVDEPLLEVSTDKVDTEIPSPFAGVLQEIRVGEDETAEVGSVLAVIGSGASSAPEQPSTEQPAAEPVSEPAAPAQAPADSHSANVPAPAQPAPAQAAPAQAAPAQPASAQPAPPAVSSSSSATKPGYVTPIVRKLAHDNGVDLAAVEGTGVGGRIRKEDVQKAAEAAKAAQVSASAAPATPAPSAPAAPAVSAEALAKRGTVEKTPRIRQVIARRMKESLQVSAQLTQVHEVDMTKVAKLRAAAKNTFAAQNGGVKLTFLPFIAKAVAEALKQHPKLNASFDEEKNQITYFDAEHLAIAVDTERGLLVPVIADAGNLNLAGMASKIADVAARTRNNKIAPDELSGGTFSITNFGSVGALFDTPIINQPQVAILGVGTIVKRPVVVTDAEGEDTIAIRQMMYLSLTYDHRLVDGADAGRFLQTVKARLEGGQFQADLGL